MTGDESRGKKLSPRHRKSRGGKRDRTSGEKSGARPRGVVNFYAIRAHLSATARNSRMESQKAFD